MTFGRYVDGVKTGIHWRRMEGNSYLIGHLNSDNEIDGEECFYLYPDLQTVIVGNFSRGKMVRGQLAQFTGIRCVLIINFLHSNDVLGMLMEYQFLITARLTTRQPSAMNLAQGSVLPRTP